MDNKAILCVIAVFFAVGGIDDLIGNRLGLGSVFLETLQKMGMILLGVMGIYSLAPVAAEYVGAAVTPLADALHMDPSVFPAMLFPVDMGGFQLAVETAKDPRMGLVSGALVASLCGATVGYTITVASTVMDKRFFPQLARGILSGMAGIPVGCVVGAVLAGVPLPAALYNCLPLWVLAGLLMWGLLCAPEKMTKGFTVFGRILSAIAVVGLILQAVQMLTGWTILPGMASAQEGLRARAAQATASLGARRPVYQTVLPRFSILDGKCAELELLPVDLGLDGPKWEKGVPRLADARAAEEICAYLNRVSAPYGTRWRVQGQAIVQTEGGKA